MVQSKHAGVNEFISVHQIRQTKILLATDLRGTWGGLETLAALFLLLRCALLDLMCDRILFTILNRRPLAMGSGQGSSVSRSFNAAQPTQRKRMRIGMSNAILK